MKKFLTTLLLLTFCTIQISWAGDVIIIGSDGQARYENESKNIPVTQANIQNTKQKNILNEFTITDDRGKTENIYIDYKGNVKKFEVGQSSSTIQTTVNKTVESRYEKCVAEAQKFLYNVDSILYQYGYEKNYKNSKSKQEYMKMDLLDGDFVIGYKDAPFLAEYHKDGELMGLIKVDKKILNEQRGNITFYEYRAGYNTTSGMGLKHILFLDFEKDKYISQYIYKHDGTLLCRQQNNDIYIANEARNMIPDWSKREINNKMREIQKKTAKNNNQPNKTKQKKQEPTVGIGDYAAIGLGTIGLGFLVVAAPLIIPIWALAVCFCGI